LRPFHSESAGRRAGLGRVGMLVLVGGDDRPGLIFCPAIYLVRLRVHVRQCGIEHERGCGEDHRGIPDLGTLAVPRPRRRRRCSRAQSPGQAAGPSLRRGRSFGCAAVRPAGVGSGQHVDAEWRLRAVGVSPLPDPDTSERATTSIVMMHAIACVSTGMSWLFTVSVASASSPSSLLAQPVSAMSVACAADAALAALIVSSFAPDNPTAKQTSRGPSFDAARYWMMGSAENSAGRPIVSRSNTAAWQTICVGPAHTNISRRAVAIASTARPKRHPAAPGRCPTPDGIRYSLRLAESDNCCTRLKRTDADAAARRRRRAKPEAGGGPYTFAWAPELCGDDCRGGLACAAPPIRLQERAASLPRWPGRHQARRPRSRPRSGPP
jgi:hypothetical protein